MKRSLAAWLLVGLSLCVPQFCKGEAAGPGPLGAGQAKSPPGSAAQGAGSSTPSGPGVASSAGGAEEAAHPDFPRKVLAKPKRVHGAERDQGSGTGVRSRKQKERGEAGGNGALGNQGSCSSLGHLVAVWTLPGLCWGSTFVGPELRKRVYPGVTYLKREGAGEPQDRQSPGCGVSSRETSSVVCKSKRR